MQDESQKDDPLAEMILALLEEAGPEGSISPDDAARAYAEIKRRKKDPPDLWRRYIQAANQQALHLARQERIVILRRGEPVNPNKPIKGLIRLAQPGPGRVVPPLEDAGDDDWD
ncbi:DUF3253 domain-containing protein [Limibacillus halophilus]|jgi:hypothetical protein